MLIRMIFLAFLLPMTACSFWNGTGQDAGVGTVAMPRSLDDSPVGLTGELNQFGSCQELESWLREEMLSRAAHTMAWDKYYYFAQRGGFGRASNSSGAASEPVADTATSEASEQTSTNNQVVGMDEGDIVKHVGDRIYSLAGTYLHILKSWPATEMAHEGRLEFPYQPESMLITEGRAVVFAHINDIDAPDISSSWSSKQCMGCGLTGAAVIARVDISNPTTPTLMEEKKYHGFLLAARQSAGIVRYVLQRGHRYPRDFLQSAPLYERRPSTVNDADAIINEVMTQNVSLVKDWRLSDWFGDVTAFTASDCQTIYRPSARSELALTTVTTLNPSTGSEQVTGVLAQASEVYASEKSLYLANHYYGRHETEFRPHTFIHKFSLASDSTRYEASGGLEGYIINQFAMDEKDEHLRLAVTAQAADGYTANQIVTMAQDASVLSIQGQTPDLAHGERIYSVRFDGDKGYLVTFRQVDPLFILDLSDPLAPRVTGELKIPGFSSYLHKVGDNRLLGVGQQNGLMKLSLFDVADPTAPRELDALLLEGWTDVGYDHHSFSFAPWLQTLVLPRMSEVNYGLSTFRIENDVIVKGQFFSAAPGSDGWASGRNGLRSVFRDNVLYTLSQGGIAARDLTQNGLLLKGVSYP